MKRKVLAGISGILAFLLLGGNVLLAQRNQVHVSPKARTKSLWNEDDRRPQLGVLLSEVTTEQARELKLSGEYGAVVKEVEENSAAAKAGLAANDVILEFDGERVRSVAQLRRLIHDTPSGRTVTVKISRAGQPRMLNVKLEAVTSEQEPRDLLLHGFEVPEIRVPSFNYEFFGGGPRLGISADELTPQLAKYFGVAQGKGVLVREVTAGSAAEKGGLRAGDCIVRVDSEAVESITDMHRALGRSTEQKQLVSLTIVRDRHERTLSVQLEPSQQLMPGRIARNDFIGMDPDTLNRMRAELQASSLALRAARKALEGQRYNLIYEKQHRLIELRRELEKSHLKSSSRGVN